MPGFFPVERIFILVAVMRIRFLIIGVLILAKFPVFGQENKGKSVATDWEQTYYYSYFSKYYYGYYKDYGASEIGLEVGVKGWNIDLVTWLRDQYGAGIGYATGYKGENGLSLIFSYALRPSWRVNIGPVIRFIPATLEEEKRISAGFDIDVVYYYFKDIGFKVGYGSTTSFTLGAAFRINNLILER